MIRLTASSIAGIEAKESVFGDILIDADEQPAPDWQIRPYPSLNSMRHKTYELQK